MKFDKFERDGDGNFPTYAWPGGYPIFYLDQGDCVLCSKCATQEYKVPEKKELDVPHGIHWEGEPIQCEECGKEIESAYGPVEKTCRVCHKTFAEESGVDGDQFCCDACADSWTKHSTDY